MSHFNSYKENSRIDRMMDGRGNIQSSFAIKKSKYNNNFEPANFKFPKEHEIAK